MLGWEGGVPVFVPQVVPGGRGLWAPGPLGEEEAAREVHPVLGAINWGAPVREFLDAFSCFCSESCSRVGFLSLVPFIAKVFPIFAFGRFVGNVLAY